MNNDNLVDLRSRTTEEQRAIQRKGGKASGRTRKTQATFRALLNDALKTKLSEHEIVDELKRLGVIKENAEIDMKTAIAYARLFRELNNPTPEGFEKLMKAIGEESTPDDKKLDKLDEVLSKIEGNI